MSCKKIKGLPKGSSAGKSSGGGGQRKQVGTTGRITARGKVKKDRGKKGGSGFMHSFTVKNGYGEKNPKNSPSVG